MTLPVRQDLHVHTTMSDGEVDLAEVVRLAAERGVTVGIADHVSMRNPGRFVSNVERLAAYLQAVEAQPVFVAGELCWGDSFGAGLPDALTARFDYRIGSNHGWPLPDGSWGSPWWATLPAPWDAQPQALMESMVENLAALVRTMPIQLVAHSTFMPAALLSYESDVLAWWTEEREDRFVDALVESGVAVEISSRYRLPHDRFLLKALQAGVKFTLGSDAHRAEQVANLDWSVETARRVGIGEADIWRPEATSRLA